MPGINDVVSNLEDNIDWLRAPVWTYMFFQFSTLRGELNYDTVESFRMFGRDGWELATINNLERGAQHEYLAVFKRPEVVNE